MAKKFFILLCAGLILTQSSYATKAQSLVFDQPFDQLKKKKLSRLKTSKQIEALKLFLNQSPYIEKAIQTKNTALTYQFPNDPYFELSSQNPIAKAQKTKTSALVSNIDLNREFFKSQSNGVFVVDESEFLSGSLKPISGAKIHWIHQNSKLHSISNNMGYAPSPFIREHKTRFIIKADGYHDFVGYAISGKATPAVLVPENRHVSILKSLDMSPLASLVNNWNERNSKPVIAPNKHTFFSKVVDQNLMPLRDVEIDLSQGENARSFYSGENYLFMPTSGENNHNEHTGPLGDFLSVKLLPALQYFMPADVFGDDWSPAIIDLKGTSQFITGTLMRAAEATVSTKFLDAKLGLRPVGDSYLLIGGQKGLFKPGKSGRITITNMEQRPFVDLVELKSKDYLSTWISATPFSQSFPKELYVYSKKMRDQIQFEAKKVSKIDYKRSAAIAFIKIKNQNLAKDHEIKFLNSEGKNVAVTEIATGNTALQNFAANKASYKSSYFLGLGTGEYHALLIEKGTQKIKSIQVLRTQEDTVSQVEFN